MTLKALAPPRETFPWVRSADHQPNGCIRYHCWKSTADMDGRLIKREEKTALASECCTPMFNSLTADKNILTFLLCFNVCSIYGFLGIENTWIKKENKNKGVMVLNWKGQKYITLCSIHLNAPHFLTIYIDEEHSLHNKKEENQKLGALSYNTHIQLATEISLYLKKRKHFKGLDSVDYIAYCTQSVQNKLPTAWALCS